MIKPMIGLVVTGLLWSAQSLADAESLQQVLFKGVAGVPTAMQKSIAEQLVAKSWQVQSGQIAEARCGVVPHQVDVLDLNKDGQTEVMLLLGNACTSGKIGTTVYLFTQEANGRVQRHLGFSATGYKAYARDGEAWPDLLFTGTGDCQPVWRYKGGRYNFNHLYEAKPGACYVPQSDNFGG
jgi:hypothetical protein